MELVFCKAGQRCEGKEHRFWDNAFGGRTSQVTLVKSVLDLGQDNMMARASMNEFFRI